MKTFKKSLVAALILFSTVGVYATYSTFVLDVEQELVDDLERLAVTNNQLRTQRDKLQNSADVLTDIIEKNSLVWTHKRALLELQQNPDKYKESGK